MFILIDLNNSHGYACLASLLMYHKNVIFINANSISNILINILKYSLHKNVICSFMINWEKTNSLSEKLLIKLLNILTYYQHWEIYCPQDDEYLMPQNVNNINLAVEIGKYCFQSNNINIEIIGQCGNIINKILKIKTR